MYVDKQNEFSDAQAVTSTAISTNVIDLQSASLDIGAGNPVYLVVQTQTAATDTSSDATLTITLESDSTADLATSATTHLSSGALAFATFSPAGALLMAVALPIDEYERYLGIRYTVASGPLTAGNFDAFLTTDVSKFRAYPIGYTSAEA